jgi:hypothetical protein
MYTKIKVFDDGNKKYKNYENKWLVLKKIGGKLLLKNGLKIISISTWKTDFSTLKIYNK